MHIYSAGECSDDYYMQIQPNVCDKPWKEEEKCINFTLHYSAGIQTAYSLMDLNLFCV